MATQKVGPDPVALERKQRWQAGKGKAAVYALVAGLLIAGVVVGISTLGGDERGRPAGQRDPATGLTREQLAGVWRQTKGIDTAGQSPLLSFGTDGTFAIDNQGALDTGPVMQGTYGLDGDNITLTDSGVGCDEMKWRVSLAQEGVLEHTMADPATGACGQALHFYIEGSEFSYMRLSPRSPASEDVTSDGQAKQGEPPTGLYELAGIWLLDGGDHLLRISFDATYAIADAGTLVTDPDDAGTVELGEEGTLTFTSGSESRTCPEGTVTVWENVQVHLDALAADVPQDACGEMPPERASWLMVSRAG